MLGIAPEIIVCYLDGLTAIPWHATWPLAHITAPLGIKAFIAAHLPLSPFGLAYITSAIIFSHSFISLLWIVWITLFIITLKDSVLKSVTFFRPAVIAKRFNNVVALRRFYLIAKSVCFYLFFDHSCSDQILAGAYAASL